MRRPPRPPVAVLARVVIALVAALVVFGAGILVGGHPVETGLTRLPEPVRGLVLGNSGQDLSAEVLDALEEGYYREIDLQALQQRSVEAIIAELDDPFTDYLDPEELRALRAHTEGAYFGVGLQVAERPVGLVVTRVFPDSPAAVAGVRRGDRLVSVDGRPTDGQRLQSAVASIRGPEGTTVRLGILPAAAAVAADEPNGANGANGAAVRELELERARIRVSAVRSRVERVGQTRVGYVGLSAFTEGAGADLRAAVAAHQRRPVQALVLDLRGDPGGLVREAVAVAGVFLSDGAPVVTTEGRQSPERTLLTEGMPLAPDLPLVVLVDEQSASSSEIVAGALRDNDRATLVGTTTFGKALVQSTRLLRDGGALKLTTARYLTPDGVDVSAVGGLTPDVRVRDDPETPVDEALRRALRVATAGL